MQDFRGCSGETRAQSPALGTARAVKGKGGKEDNVEVSCFLFCLFVLHILLVVTMGTIINGLHLQQSELIPT